MDAIIVPLSGGLSSTVDAELYEAQLTIRFRDGFSFAVRVCDYLWQPLFRPHTTYARITSRRAGKPREVLLHRLVMQAPPGVLVDHRDHDGLNNTRENLRLVTSHQNGIGSLSPRRLRSQLPRGVVIERRKKGMGYIAQIKVRGSGIRLGVFDDPESAARAYDAAAIKHFGNFAVLNFPLTA